MCFHCQNRGIYLNTDHTLTYMHMFIYTCILIFGGVMMFINMEWQIFLCVEQMLIVAHARWPPRAHLNARLHLHLHLIFTLTLKLLFTETKCLTQELNKLSDAISPTCTWTCAGAVAHAHVHVGSISIFQAHFHAHWHWHAYYNVNVRCIHIDS